MFIIAVQKLIYEDKIRSSKVDLDDSLISSKDEVGEIV